MLSGEKEASGQACVVGTRRDVSEMTMSGAWLAWECAVFALFVFLTTCAPLMRRAGPGASAGAAGATGDEAGKRGYVFAAGGVSTLAMMLSVSRGTLGVRSFLGEYRTRALEDVQLDKLDE